MCFVSTVTPMVSFNNRYTSVHMYCIAVVFCLKITIPTSYSITGITFDCLQLSYAYLDVGWSKLCNINLCVILSNSEVVL